MRTEEMMSEDEQRSNDRENYVMRLKIDEQKLAITRLTEENQSLKGQLERLKTSVKGTVTHLKQFEEGSISSANHPFTDPMMKIWHEGQAKTYAMVRKWLEEDIA